MRVEQQPGFVLHARAWRETSLLLEVLTQDYGRIGLIARGIRRDKTRMPRALLQPLAPIRLSWSGRGELATLTGADPAGMAIALTGESLLCALYLNELVTRLLQRHDPHPEIFGGYVEALGRLASGDPASWTLRRFERDLLAQLGYGLQLMNEADTGLPIQAQAHYGYLLDAGPFPWRNDRDGLKLTGAALLALAHDAAPSAADLAALRRLLRALIAQRLDGASLRAWSLLGEMRGSDPTPKSGAQPGDGRAALSEELG